MKHIILLVVCLVLAVPVLAADTNTTVSSTVTSSNNTVSSNTIDRTPPTASAPNVVINNQDVCVTAIGGAAQTSIVGLSVGSTLRDKNCERLKLARSLYGMGMKVASVSMLCQDTRVFQAMEMAGTPCPIDGKIGEEAKIIWDEEPYRRPDYDEWKETVNGKIWKQELENSYSEEPTTYNNNEEPKWDDDSYY